MGGAAEPEAAFRGIRQLPDAENMFEQSHPATSADGQVGRFDAGDLEGYKSVNERFKDE